MTEKFRITIELLGTAEEFGLEGNIDATATGDGLWPSDEWLITFSRTSQAAILKLLKQYADDPCC